MSDRSYDAEHARKIILDACQEIAELDRSSEDDNNEELDTSSVMVYGAALILETKDMETGSTYITQLSTDSAGEALAFWTVMGYVRYLDEVAKKLVDPPGSFG
jgi:hypothetical protein